MRRQQLRDHPLCAMCLKQGLTVLGTVVDHVLQHKGDTDIFFNGKLQTLCKPHHDSTKQRDEKRGYVGGCDVSGVPIDPNSHWNR